MAELNMVEALNHALAYELAHDPAVLLLGEDIGVNGGVFRATVGLQARFGAQRVIDTPLAETAIAGTAIGMAAMGLKPVAEIQFSGFIYPTIDHILNHASRLRHRTARTADVPACDSCAVWRRYSRTGASFREPRSVVHPHPRTACRDAVVPCTRIRLAASGDPRPGPGDLLRADATVPALQAAGGGYRRSAAARQLLYVARWVRRYPGELGGALQDVQAAADLLAQEGVMAEVIDVATLKPLDMNTILASVAKTGRCVIVHEGSRTGGVGAEIAANIGERGLYSLLAPVQRVTGYDVVAPLYRLENQYMPGTERIVAAVRQALEAS